MMGFNPIAGIHPHQLQQLQLAHILAQRAAAAQLLGVLPLAGGLQNPLGGIGFENPLLNPILAQQLQFPQQIYGGNPQVGQFGPQIGQGGLPYLQPGQGLAPQSWVGQPMVHPLIAQQLAGRGFHGPWAGY